MAEGESEHVMIRIMSYNVHGGKGCDRRRDYSRIGLFLEKCEADIVLLQEVDTRKSKDPLEDMEKLTGRRFKHFIPGGTIFTEKGWYGNAVMSRFPAAKTTIMDISQSGREPRNIMEVFITTDEGLLHVVNTHKGLAKAERGFQLAKLHELLSRKSDVPLIVGGDINEWHASAAALRELNKMLTPLNLGPTYPTIMPVFHLDRLWCRPGTMISRYGALRTKETRLYSDHYPVMADISL